LSPNVPDVDASKHLSPDEAAEIARALQEADDEEARKSFQLALQLQSHEASLFTSKRQRNARRSPQAREDYAVEQAAGARRLYDDGGAEARHRVNAAPPGQNWDRVRNHVLGSNSEAHALRRVGVDDDDAYSSFRQSIQRQKGVTGSGRATSDTKSGAMDQRVRMLITRAINNRLIKKCNGIVREGKEAVIYHADQGEEGGGYDVAIKVFRHMDEVRGRSDYVDGDPRFDGKFRNASSREMLEMWAEKEYRNLLRANRSGVLVPTPLIQKENVVCMCFLREDGWAVPQLKDLQLRKGSNKWTTLYSQIMVAIIRRLAQYASDNLLIVVLLLISWAF
jgi:serine/threonine-protein kinase RIO1